MSQMSIRSQNPRMEDLLPHPKKQWNLACPLSFHHPMAAEGGALVSHEVIENPTENKTNKQTTKTDCKTVEESTNKKTAFLGFAIKTFVQSKQCFTNCT